jgi:hypothetical protein
LVVGVDHRWDDGGGGADLPVVGVGLQEDNAQSEGVNDGTNSVVDVAVRRLEAGRRDARGKLDHLHLVTLYHQSALGHEWDGELTVFHISANACSLGDGGHVRV